MVGRMYSVVFSAVAVTAAQDVFEISPADDKPLRVHGVFLGQYTDFTDTQDELLSWQVIRGFTAGGSGGSSITPRPLDRSGSAAGFTAEANNTTVANTGTTHTLHADAFNVRAGLGHFWTPETMPMVSQADTTLVVRITAPADSITLNGTLYVEELG